MSELKVDLLRFLKDHSDAEFQSYQLQQYIGGSTSTINGYLVDLEIDSRVLRRSSGYNVYWRAVDQEFYVKRIISSQLWLPGIFGIDTEEE